MAAPAGVVAGHGRRLRLLDLDERTAGVGELGDDGADPLRRVRGGSPPCFRARRERAEKRLLDGLRRCGRGDLPIRDDGGVLVTTLSRTAPVRHQLQAGLLELRHRGARIAIVSPGTARSASRTCAPSAGSPRARGHRHHDLPNPIDMQTPIPIASTARASTVAIGDPMKPDEASGRSAAGLPQRPRASRPGRAGRRHRAGAAAIRPPMWAMLSTNAHREADREVDHDQDADLAEDAPGRGGRAPAGGGARRRTARRTGRRSRPKRRRRTGCSPNANVADRGRRSPRRRRTRSIRSGP